MTDSMKPSEAIELAKLMLENSDWIRTRQKEAVNTLISAVSHPVGTLSEEGKNHLCPKCGSPATFQDVSGTFYDSSAHYWKESLPSSHRQRTWRSNIIKFVVRYYVSNTKDRRDLSSSLQVTLIERMSRLIKSLEGEK